MTRSIFSVQKPLFFQQVQNKKVRAYKHHCNGLQVRGKSREKGALPLFPEFAFWKPTGVAVPAESAVAIGGKIRP
jgi:hypothetical protein